MFELKIPEIKPIEMPKEMYIDVRASENKGHNVWTVKANYIEIAIKLFKYDLGSEPANSKIKVIKRTYLDKEKTTYVDETLIDGVDDSILVRDYEYFEHEYIIIIEEKNIRIVGVIRYA